MPNDTPEPPAFNLDALDLLECDEAPAFIVEVGTVAARFDLRYCNKEFRDGGFQDATFDSTPEALRFRAWAQALGQATETQHEFAGCTWACTLSTRRGVLKMVQGIPIVLSPRSNEERPSLDPDLNPTNKNRVHKRSDGEKPNHAGWNMFTRSLPQTNLNARWEGIQSIMEMSDVGVFEYNTKGELMHANDAWYRLSLYPRDVVDHAQFSFMNLVTEPCVRIVETAWRLVYPDDQEFVLSMWNTLTQGQAVTFHMRWKTREKINDTGKWSLTSCVPIFDDAKVLISIAGNVIDIDAQKKSQEATHARLEALEQARMSELKFSRFAQLSPTAIYIFVPETGMQFVNDQFYELTGHSNAPHDKFEWFSLILDEDVHIAEDDWAAMLEGEKTDGVQFRLKKTWINQDGVEEHIFVQSTSSTHFDEGGNVLSIMGTLFDISQFKWAESVQRRRVEEALEAKRQQENFIDMTSHELRNPLSAVVQCAESAITTLEHLNSPLSPTMSTEASRSNYHEEIESTIDSLSTILTCSAHQKRVIDDVLTLSKLDSELILITPVRVQISVVILEALKMFEVECRQLDIKLDFKEDITAKEFDWVMLDPSRLLQVLINLLTNAIKFTKSRPKREITVELGGSFMRPPEVWEKITLRTSDQLRTSVLDEPGWGNGTKAYLWIKVKDTGCGMTEEEQKSLFSRFAQATPRTHVKYGGSGLGLFISKTLSSLQGGAIGVSSTKDVGSMFAFFVSTRITDPPPNQPAGLTARVRPVLNKRTLSAENAMKAVKLNVLIVEDNLVNQKVLKKQLQKFGWNVHVAGDGLQALGFLRSSIYWHGGECDEDPAPDVAASAHHEGKVDVILLDIEMPIMDGLTCVRRIREWEDEKLLAAPASRRKTERSKSTTSLTPITSNRESKALEDFRIPILAVSANARMEQIQEALRAGMDDAITKPFRIPELWPKVQGLIHRISSPEDRGESRRGSVY